MRESDLQKQIAMKFSAAGYGRLWINDNGLGYRKDGTGFKYGLGIGVSDLVGFTLVDGKPIFTAFEVKTKKGYATKEQKAFIEMVKANGGIAGVIKSFEEIKGELPEGS